MTCAFGPALARPDRQGQPLSALQHRGGAVGLDHDGRRMAGARIHQFAAGKGEHRAERGRTVGAGQPRSETVQPVEHCARTGLLEQQRPAGAAKLTHDGGGGQTMTDAVADDQRDAPLAEIDDVVPVAPDLQRLARGAVAHREAPG